MTGRCIASAIVHWAFKSRRCKFVPPRHPPGSRSAVVRPEPRRRWILKIPVAAAVVRPSLSAVSRSTLCVLTVGAADLTRATGRLSGGAPGLTEARPSSCWFTTGLASGCPVTSCSISVRNHAVDDDVGGTVSIVLVLHFSASQVALSASHWKASASTPGSTVATNRASSVCRAAAGTGGLPSPLRRGIAGRGGAPGGPLRAVDPGLNACR